MCVTQILDRLRYIAAYHEAGHVVAFLRLGFPVATVSILEDVTEETGPSIGHTDHGMKPSPWLDHALAGTMTPDMRKAEQRWRRRRVRDLAIAAYAGFWAEYEVGVPPKLSWMGARHDRQAVRRLRSVLDEDLDDPLPRRVTTGVIHARAWRLIHGHWRDVKRVAQALLAHDTLTGEALVDLLPGLVPTTRFDNDGHLVVAAIRSNLEPLTPREKRRNLTPTPEARAQAEEPIPQPPTY